MIGRSGAGKSTLAKLLLRFYDPAAGAVAIDGTDLRELTLRSLRDQIAVVFQETFVFDASIAENVAYGRPDATREQVLAAVEAAALTPFVQMQPDGLGTIVGQKGRRLSGGERQRVAIARAFLRDAPILLLDEPTTGLDIDAANHVLEPLRRLATGRTTIVITHDLELARLAGRVFVVDDGCATELDAPERLVASSGLYERLRQIGDRLVTDVAVDRPVAGDELAPGYTILSTPNRGSLFDVHEVWSEERHTRCAAKVIRPDRVHEARARRRLLSEASLISASRIRTSSVRTRCVESRSRP